MTNQTSNPSPEQLNDPEGQRLAQAIHDRKELQGTLANTICNASNYPKRAQPHLLGSDMSHVINKTADSLLAVGYCKPRVITTREELAKAHLVVVRTEAGTIANLVNGRAYCFGYEASAPVDTLALPATVLWELGAAK